MSEGFFVFLSGGNNNFLLCIGNEGVFLYIEVRSDCLLHVGNEGIFFTCWHLRTLFFSCML